MTAELLKHKANLTHSQQREKKSGSLVQELTAMVKEQKSRISELIKAKRDAVTDLKVQQDSNTFKICTAWTLNAKSLIIIIFLITLLIWLRWSRLGISCFFKLCSFCLIVVQLPSHLSAMTDGSWLLTLSVCPSSRAVCIPWKQRWSRTAVSVCSLSCLKKTRRGYCLSSQLRSQW